MPSGWQNKVTEMQGQYLVSAKLSRFNLLVLSTPTNAPGADIVVTAHPRTMNQTFDNEKLVHEIIMEVVEEFKEEGKPTDSSEFINEVADTLAPYWPLNAEKLRGLALKNWMVTLFGDRFERLVAAFEKAKEVHEKEVAASSDDWFDRMSSFRLPGVPTDGTDNKPKAESDGSGRDS